LRLALETAEQALRKTPAASRKSKPRAAQLKLAGIATIQGDEAGDAPAGVSPVAPTKQA
jgi:ribonuclease-3